jgi:hypothetical protein
MSEKHAAHTPSAHDPGGDQYAGQSVIFAAARFFILLFEALALALPFFAKKVREKQTAHTPSADDAGGGQQTNQSAVLATLVLFFATQFLVLALVSLAQKVGEKQVTHAAPTQHLAANQ